MTALVCRVGRVKVPGARGLCEAQGVYRLTAYRQSDGVTTAGVHHHVCRRHVAPFLDFLMAVPGWFVVVTPAAGDPVNVAVLSGPIEPAAASRVSQVPPSDSTRVVFSTSSRLSSGGEM